MKVSKKVIPYKLKKMVLPIMCAGLMGTACSKVASDHNIKQHDTYYYFDQDYWDELINLNQIKASADSIEVRYIIFKVLPDNNFAWINMGIPFENAIAPAFDAAKGKGRGQGTFNNVRNHPDNTTVEPIYNELGYTFQYESNTKTR